MEEKLLESIKTSLIDINIKSDELYEHKFLNNQEEKIISDIRRELISCDEFIISVAFITESGLSLILEELKILEKRGVKGKILTGDYLNFTEPKALKRILKYKNIELKILSNENFHAKGYFFKRDKIWKIMVGSSNLTQGALTKNFEWNLKISSMEEGKLAVNILEKFYKIFDKLPNIDNDYLDKYEKIYRKMKNFEDEKIEFRKDILNSIEKNRIEPNLMQKKALKNLEDLREKQKKGLLISATGTGKTYFAAFDVKKVRAKKILFLAHRKTILNKAVETFKNIIDDKKIGVYTEETFDKNDYVFAMVQTLTKDRHLLKFSKNEFDYIIIDEVHHGGAKSYQKIIDYFEPKFLLGMTATPERTDDFNIFELFDYNIVFEMRLYDALKENLLCPFHYFGISDIRINGKEIDEKTTIKELVMDDRINHIIEKSNYYGYCGNVLRGLIFVSRKEEAKIMAEKFNERGIKANYLLGDATDAERENTIRKLENGEINYIITVDIFNEGVDIPSVNQIILLRPTLSSIVYIQQLGRGLRKHKDKDFVIILDFIGNYEKNFLIPIAISENSNYDKDFMKKFLMDGTNLIPGESSVIFEEIVQERIFENINKTNFSTKKNIEHDFNYLKKKLNRVPMLLDFFNERMVNPMVILKYRKNYDEILKIFERKFLIENNYNLSSEESDFLSFISVFFTPAKRIHEMVILKYMLENDRELNVLDVEKILKKKYNLKDQRDNVLNAIYHFSKEIFKNLSTIKKYKPILMKKENKYYLSNNFKESYSKNIYFKRLVDDLLEFNLSYSYKNYKQEGKATIIEYKQYTKQEAFWYLNLDFNNGYQVSGYTTFEEMKKVILFITLEDKPLLSNYQNDFIDTKTIPWYSKSNRYLKRNGELTIEGKIAEGFYEMEVFVKKKSSENFYYLGKVDKILSSEEILGKREEPLVKYILKLKNGVDKNLFYYFAFGKKQ